MACVMQAFFYVEKWKNNVKSCCNIEKSKYNRKRREGLEPQGGNENDELKL